jgi:hypothetical protein
MSIFRRTKATMEIVVDPSLEELAVVAEIKRRGGNITFGAPTPCPRCSSYGFVERVELQAGFTDNRCPACSHSWRVTRRAIEASQIPVAPTDDSLAIGDGILVRGINGDQSPHPATDTE